MIMCRSILPVPLILLFVLLASLLAARAEAGEGDAWQLAALAPADTTLYLHIEDGAALRRQLVDRPLGRWVREELRRGQFHAAWSRIAKRAGISEGELFDLILGRGATLMLKGEPSRDELEVETAGGAGAWVVLAELPPKKSAGLTWEVMRSLRPETQPARHGLAIYTLPEYDLIIAVSRDQLLIAPLSQPALFEQVARSLSGLGAAAGDTDAGDALTASLDAAQRLGDGDFAMMLQHEAPLGGWTVVVGELEGDHLTFRQRSRFENPPFTRETTGLTIDASVVERFAHHCLVAVVEPTDIGPARLEQIVQQTIGEPLIGPELVANAGHRRLQVLGESEGRLDDEAPVDILRPTYALAVEAVAPVGGAAPLDRQMTRWATALNEKMSQVVDGSMLICVPPAGVFQTGEQRRQIDLRRATDALTGGFPIMHVPSLNWALAQGPTGSWYVIATDPAELEQVVTVLERAPEPGGEEWIGQFDSAGVLSGGRIAHHLESWLTHVESLTPPGQVDMLRAELQRLEHLARGLHDVRWRMQRPSRDEMSLEVEIELAPPVSSEGQ